MSNGWKPAIWSILVALSLAVVVGLSVNFARSGYAAGPCTADPSIDSEEYRFLDLINEYRTENGLGTLSISVDLSRAAQWKSEDMAINNYFAHDDLPIGRSWSQRIRDCGYTHPTYIGENLAAGMSTAQAAFDAWKASPGHNANMLNSNYKAIGIGLAFGQGTTYVWYWSTDFGGVEDPGGNPPPTSTPTDTPRATSTPTNTPPPANTPTPTSTPPPANTSTPTSTPPPANTPTPTSTPPPANTPTPTSTPPPANTPTPTSTPPPANTPTPTSTPPPANTPTPTSTPPPANTPTPEPTATPTPADPPTVRPGGLSDGGKRILIAGATRN